MRRVAISCASGETPPDASVTSVHVVAVTHRMDNDVHCKTSSPSRVRPLTSFFRPVFFTASTTPAVLPAVDESAVNRLLIATSPPGPAL